MTGQPWQPQPAADLLAIPVHIDPEVPAGVAVFDVDPEDPRHVTGIRVRDREYELTDEQVEQVRDHYRAMNERAAEILAWWDRTAQQLGLDITARTPWWVRESHPVLGPELYAMRCLDPTNIIRVTDI